MAYYAYITRCDADDFFNDVYPAECLIDESEWLQLIDLDEALILIGQCDAQLVGTDEFLEFHDGHSLSVRMPGEAMTEKMISIALELKAQPIGEEWPSIVDYEYDFRKAENRNAYTERLAEVAKRSAWWKFWK